MQPLRFIRNHPVALAVLMCSGFVAWLAWDLVPASGPPSTAPSGPAVASPEGLKASAQRLLPIDPIDPAQRSRHTASQPGVVTTDLLSRLQPGMARVEVEELIGLPPAQLVHPVSNIEGRLIYRASYLANFEPPPTVPVGIEPPVPTVRTMIGLEFDAGRPGHPLVKVHVPDPMS